MESHEGGTLPAREGQARGGEVEAESSSGAHDRKERAVQEAGGSGGALAQVVGLGEGTCRAEGNPGGGFDVGRTDMIQVPVARKVTGKGGGLESEAAHAEVEAGGELSPVSKLKLESDVQQEDDERPVKEKRKVGRPRKKEVKVTTKKLLPRPSVVYQDYAHMYATPQIAPTWSEQGDCLMGKPADSPAESIPSSGGDLGGAAQEEDVKDDGLRESKRRGRKAEGASKQARKKPAGPAPAKWPFYPGMPYPYVQQGHYPPGMFAPPFPPYFPPLPAAAGPPFHMSPIPHTVPAPGVQMQPPTPSYHPPSLHHVMHHPFLHQPFQAPPMYNDLVHQLQQVSSFFAQLVPNLCKVCQATAVQLAPPPYQAVFFCDDKHGEPAPQDEQETDRKRQRSSVIFSQQDLVGQDENGVMIHAPREFLSKRVKKDGTASLLPSLKEHVYYIPADGDPRLDQQKIKGGKRKRPVIYIKWQAFERLGRHAVDLDLHVKDGLRLKELKKRKLQLQEALKEQGQEIKRLKCEIAGKDDRIQRLRIAGGYSNDGDDISTFPRDEAKLTTQQDVVHSVVGRCANSPSKCCGGQYGGTVMANEEAASGHQSSLYIDEGRDDTVMLGSGSDVPSSQKLKGPKGPSLGPKLSRIDKQKKYNSMVKDMLKRQQCVSNGIVVFEASPATKSQGRQEQENVQYFHDNRPAEAEGMSAAEGQGSEGVALPAAFSRQPQVNRTCPEVSAPIVPVMPNCHPHGQLQRHPSGLPRLSLQLIPEQGERLGGSSSVRGTQVHPGGHQQEQMVGHPNHRLILHQHHRDESHRDRHYPSDPGAAAEMQQQQQQQQQFRTCQPEHPDVTHQHVEQGHRYSSHPLVQSEYHRQTGPVLRDNMHCAACQQQQQLPPERHPPSSHTPTDSVASREGSPRYVRSYHRQ